jgi:hypothetical protein
MIVPVSVPVELAAAATGVSAPGAIASAARTTPDSATVALTRIHRCR